VAKASKVHSKLKLKMDVFLSLKFGVVKLKIFNEIT